jgi:TonB family protein
MPSSEAVLTVVVSILATAASCAAPRASVLETPATPTTSATPAALAAPADDWPPMPMKASPSDNVANPYRPLAPHGTVTVTFAPGAPVLISGESLIEPDEGTRRAIEASGVDEVTGALEFCSDSEGSPTKVTIIRSTQYVAYDQALDEGARRWRFMPRQIRGKYVSSCSRVQLTYRPRRN